tara:strand:+ start:159 stop:2450 length:2292 start_codon:yes stop_codon:yes gene_type:complete
MAKSTKFSLYDKYIKEFKKKQKVKSEKHYSSYWMDDGWSSKGNTSRFGGWSDDVRATGSGDIVKLIKLSSYQRAIANFVKIVTDKDIPVVFGGSDSMTDGKQVILASDISDKNFDVSVGLALHEASHIKLTTFNALKNYIDLVPWSLQSQFKTIVNIIEDRRIDNYIFKSSPGYRAYYHKMYDHYFYSDNITKALLSSDFRDADNWAHWELRLANLTNPMTDLDALPGFREIYDMIDVKSIGRLKSTEEVIALSQLVFDKIKSVVHDAQMNPDKYKQSEKDKPSLGSSEEGTNDDSDNESGEDQNSQMGNANMTVSGVDGDKSDQDTDADNSAKGSGEGNDGDSVKDGVSNSSSTGGSGQHLTPHEQIQIQKAWAKQKQFLNEEVTKKKTTKKLQKELENVSKMDLDLQMVGDNMNGFQCVIYDLSRKNYLRTITALCKEHSAIKDNDPNAAERKKQVIEALANVSNRNMSADRKYWSLENDMNIPCFLRSDNTVAIMAGMDLGSLLGRKLRVRNEERSLVHNRLMSGHIDAKRLSHAGYGIETVFKQVHVDKYKQVCLHITIDASGSMSGKKWTETVKMTTAIVKAASYVQNLRIQVSARTTDSGARSGGKDLPVIVHMYDSKHNNLKHYIDVMKVVGPSGCTPEGLCFDAMMKRNLLMPSTNECTSYMLNISDGAPGMSGWGGQAGIGYTRKMVQKMRNDLGVNVLSFYVEESHRIKNSNEPSKEFREMYGKDARLVGSDNVTAIARELNSKFLSEGKYTV